MMAQSGLYIPQWFSMCPQEQQLALLEALEQVPLKVRLEEQEGILGALTPEELATCALDLRPFMQRTPFVLQARFLVTIELL